jgi:histone acetyltransferase SAS3
MAGEPSTLVGQDNQEEDSELDGEHEEDLETYHTASAAGTVAHNAASDGDDDLDAEGEDEDAEGEDEDAEGEDDDEIVGAVKIPEDELDDEDGDEDAAMDSASDAKSEADSEAESDAVTESDPENAWEAESDTAEEVEAEIVDPNQCM